jgi:putative transcriptional regulator
MRSLQGHFLVASPHLSDPNFFRSVVLMIRHDEEGALGLLLNRPTENTIDEIWKMLDAPHEPSPEPIYLGGPVGGPLMALHSLRSCSEAEVATGVYFAAHRDHLNKLVTQTSKKYRIFSGYSGWSAGQLERELEAGGWLTCKATKRLVFQPTDKLWKEVMQSIGDEIIAPVTRGAAMPDDPQLN